MQLKNLTTTAGGLISFGIAWPKKLYRLITKDAKKQKKSKGEIVKTIVENHYKNAKN